ncbi:MAG TPA: hypothetical protein PK728_09545 [Bacillota bacterium]|nr:hypothetical protein [Bacillota bacterium]
MIKTMPDELIKEIKLELEREALLEERIEKAYADWVEEELCGHGVVDLAS